MSQQNIGVVRRRTGCTCIQGPRTFLAQFIGVMHPQAEQDVKFVRKFLLGGECWRMRVVKLAAFSRCIEDDD